MSKKNKNILSFKDNENSGEFAPIYEKFPEVTSRVIEIRSDELGVPKGKYILIESYCMDSSCDCRKVMISVHPEDRQSEIIATIGFGWETMEFYLKWAYDDHFLAEQIIGIYLEPGGIQTIYAKKFLDIFRDCLDKKYIKKIKSHYQLVRFKI